MIRRDFLRLGALFVPAAGIAPRIAYSFLRAPEAITCVDIRKMTFALDAANRESFSTFSVYHRDGGLICYGHYEGNIARIDGPPVAVRSLTGLGNDDQVQYLPRFKA